ncbi:MAG TPA: hypothetical protein VFS40_01690 [Gemmatimonadales bacterium]|nr:hypothetical protein [Gemmatimonadales bacterium]
MMANRRVWWLAAATVLCGVAALGGILGTLLGRQGRYWWLALWWGGTILTVAFGHRWDVARKAAAARARDAAAVESTPEWERNSPARSIDC